jgi:hypothetical protein
VKDSSTLLRIRRLAIPPAWKNVWISPYENGHIQATGRDARGRKQYRYHPRFRAARDETKYEKLFDFVAALPKIRAQCERDLSLPGLPREKVLAAVVRLLEQTLIRVGNEEYSRQNQSFGLTTLRDRHARIRGSEVLFRFRGKSGKEHRVSLNDRRLAKIVKRCRDLPGDELFQYLDEQGVDILGAVPAEGGRFAREPRTESAKEVEAPRRPEIDLTVEPSLDSLRLYLRSIGRVQLLTADREVALAQGMYDLRADGLAKTSGGLTSIREVSRVAV